MNICNFIKSLYYITGAYGVPSIESMHKFMIDKDRYKAMDRQYDGIERVYKLYTLGEFEEGCPSIYFRKDDRVNIVCNMKCKECWKKAFKWCEENMVKGEAK